jgi:hypothetical protein
MSARTDAEATMVQATSGVTSEGIEEKLKEVLGAEYVEIADLSGMCIEHFLAFSSVISKQSEVSALLK